MRVKNFCVSIHIDRKPIHFLSFLESSKRIGNQIFYFCCCFYTLLFHRDWRIFYRILKFVVHNRIFFLFLSFLFTGKGFNLLKDVVFDVLFPLFTLLFCISRIGSFLWLEDQFVIFFQTNWLGKNILSHFINLIHTLVKTVDCQFIENEISIVEVIIQLCIVLFELIHIRLQKVPFGRIYAFKIFIINILRVGIIDRFWVIMKIGKCIFHAYHYGLHFFVIILRGVETEHQRHKRRKHQ
ncbi:hypothetical protein D3C72_1632610 [compost metagenome]